MVVKCVTYKSKFQKWPSHASPIDSVLKIGKHYKVYGLVFQKKYTLYAICQNADNTFPFLWADDLFEIVESKVSQYFHFGHMITFEGKRPFLSFKEWAEDDSFYGKMVDWEPQAEEIFEGWRKKIDSENSSEII